MTDMTEMTDMTDMTDMRSEGLKKQDLYMRSRSQRRNITEILSYPKALLSKMFYEVETPVA